MAAPTSFPLVRGRKMRITKLDACGSPVYGSESVVVTSGFVSVALTANITEAEEISVVNAAGQTCVKDTGAPQFDGYNVDLTFCEVDPCLFTILTGQAAVESAAGDVVGFKMNSDISTVDSAFALEVWSGVPGVACTPGSGGSYGYILLPYLQAGVIGDFTIENAAITFVVSGAKSRDGNSWAEGPYDVVEDITGLVASPLPEPLEANDHLYVSYTTIAPPDDTDGCGPLVAATGLLVAGRAAQEPSGPSKK